MNNDDPLDGLLLIITRVFLGAWLFDIVYDVFAPENFPHFTYWTAVLIVLLFLFIVGAVRGKRKGD
ncbi:hypothetical protein LCGC14_3145080 [marine sediment metagenome]|uniref:Uncharacterized protein n=1 Tax=marine sediment metagenome TaxID=412755 RepID=A0A0F8Y2Q1_9ZZZZ